MCMYDLVHTHVRILSDVFVCLATLLEYGLPLFTKRAGLYVPSVFTRSASGYKVDRLD